MSIGNEILTALLGLIIGTLLGNEISRFLNKPKVVVRYKNLSPMITHDGFFWSIIIINLGRTVATDCIGFISLFNVNKEDILEELDADKEESLPSYSYENTDISYPRSQLVKGKSFREIRNSGLCWARLGNPNKVDINPGMVANLDVCKCQYSKTLKRWYLIFPSEMGWRKVRIRINLKPQIHGRIFICPSNEFPTLIDFKITISDDGTPVFMAIKYNILKRLKRRINRSSLFS